MGRSGRRRPQAAGCAGDAEEPGAKHHRNQESGRQLAASGCQGPGSRSHLCLRASRSDRQMRPLGGWVSELLHSGAPSRSTAWRTSWVPTALRPRLAAGLPLSRTTQSYRKGRQNHKVRSSRIAPDAAALDAEVAPSVHPPAPRVIRSMMEAPPPTHHRSPRPTPNAVPSPMAVCSTASTALPRSWIRSSKSEGIA